VLDKRVVPRKSNNKSGDKNHEYESEDFHENVVRFPGLYNLFDHHFIT